MDWRKVFAYITGTVDEGLLLRNEYLAAENRILMMEQLHGRLRMLTDPQRKTLAEIGFRLGRQALADVYLSSSCLVSAVCSARWIITCRIITRSGIIRARATCCYFRRK